MLDEPLFSLFLAQVGTVDAITACIVGVMGPFYAEITVLGECHPERPLEAPARSINECV